MDGLDLLGAGHPANTSSLQRCDAADAASLRERNEILRHLRNYAASHKLDVRNNIRALQLDLLEAGVGRAPPRSGPSRPRAASFWPTTSS